MTIASALRSQFIVFVLFGDVIIPRGGRVWTGSLLQLLQVLGVGERAARSTLSRMKRKGWLHSQRDGRRSSYTMTPRGERLMAEGGQRIYEHRGWSWDGRWCLVAYSLPESKRRLRRALRRRLAWLGFGSLAPGTWISAHNRKAEVHEMLRDLGAEDHVQLFTGLRLSLGNDRDLVEQVWDLKRLFRQYAAFLRRWEPEFERRSRAGATALSPADCFVQGFWLSHDYSAFPRVDPNLPVELLPEGWPGMKAERLFEDYRLLLAGQAERFVESAMESPNGWELTTRRRRQSRAIACVV